MKIMIQEKRFYMLIHLKLLIVMNHNLFKDLNYGKQKKFHLYKKMNLFMIICYIEMIKQLKQLM